MGPGPATKSALARPMARAPFVAGPGPGPGPNFGPMALSYVLCPMSYGLCPMSYVLCPMSYVLCPMAYVPCPMSYGLCPVAYVLCRMAYVLCSMSYGPMGNRQQKDKNHRRPSKSTEIRQQKDTGIEEHPRNCQSSANRGYPMDMKFGGVC